MTHSERSDQLPAVCSSKGRRRHGSRNPCEQGLEGRSSSQMPCKRIEGSARVRGRHEQKGAQGCDWVVCSGNTAILRIERETELGPSRAQPMASSMRDCKDFVFILLRTEKQPKAVWTKGAVYLIYIRAINPWAGETRKDDLWHGDPTEMPAEMVGLAFRIWWQRLCNSPMDWVGEKRYKCVLCRALKQEAWDQDRPGWRGQKSNSTKYKYISPARE